MSVKTVYGIIAPWFISYSEEEIFRVDPFVQFQQQYAITHDQNFIKNIYVGIPFIRLHDYKKLEVKLYIILLFFGQLECILPLDDDSTKMKHYNSAQVN